MTWRWLHLLWRHSHHRLRHPLWRHAWHWHVAHWGTLSVLVRSWTIRRTRRGVDVSRWWANVQKAGILSIAASKVGGVVASVRLRWKHRALSRCSPRHVRNPMWRTMSVGVTQGGRRRSVAWPLESGWVHERRSVLWHWRHWTWRHTVALTWFMSLTLQACCRAMSW